MSVTEVFALVWVLTMLVGDLILWRTGKETVSAMMTRFGKSHWWVPIAYVVPLTYLFFHFWPWLWPF